MTRLRVSERVSETIDVGGWLFSQMGSCDEPSLPTCNDGDFLQYF